MSDAPPKYSAPALEKGLDIIEFLAQAPQAVSQAQIAKELGRTPSEIFRMVTILEKRGYLEKSMVDGALGLTPKLFELAHRQPGSRVLLSHALPHMHHLANELKHSCHLAVRNSTRALVLAQVDGPELIGFVVRVGARWFLPDACSGQILLAFQEPWLQEEWLRECELDLESSKGKALRQRLNKIRRQGYARVSSQAVRGVTDLAAPILDQLGSAIASLTVPYLRPFGGGIAAEDALQSIQESADAISASLGGAGFSMKQGPL